MTKLQESIYKRYLNSELTTLRECYNSYSWYKESAYQDCCKRFAEKNGQRFRIISYNSMQFTIGFTFIKDNVKYFHYESAHSRKEWRIN